MNAKKNYKTNIIQHYELNHFFSLIEPWDICLCICIPCAILMIVSREYNTKLLAFDLTSLFMFLLYRVVIYPLIVKGKITVYYRKSYNDIYWILKILRGTIIIGASKFPLIGFYIFEKLITKKYVIESLMNVIISNLAIVILTFIVGLLFVYFLYFSKKEIDAKVYTEELMKIWMKFPSLNDMSVHYSYIDELNRKEIAETEIQNDEIQSESVEKPESTNIDESKNNDITIHENEEFIRRKARNLN